MFVTPIKKRIFKSECFGKRKGLFWRKKNPVFGSPFAQLLGKKSYAESLSRRWHGGIISGNRKGYMKCKMESHRETPVRAARLYLTLGEMVESLKTTYILPEDSDTKDLFTSH